MKPITIIIALALFAGQSRADDAPVFGPQLPPDPGAPQDPGPPSPGPTIDQAPIPAPAPQLTAREEEEPDYASAPSIYVTFGGEVLGGEGGITTAATRFHGGLTQAFGGGSVRPFLGAGGTFAGGDLSKDDVRALDGTLSLGYLEYGPEALVGLRFVNGGYVDTRLFLSAAYLWTDIDHRIMLDPVGGVGNTTHGLRASLGVNWEDHFAHWVMNGKGGKDDMTWLVYFLPQQIELDYERSLGGTRYGVTLSYGI